MALHDFLKRKYSTTIELDRFPVQYGSPVVQRLTEMAVRHRKNHVALERIAQKVSRFARYEMHHTTADGKAYYGALEVTIGGARVKVLFPYQQYDKRLRTTTSHPPEVVSTAPVPEHKVRRLCDRIAHYVEIVPFPEPYYR